MANEAEYTLGTEVVMETSGASLTDGAFAECADGTFNTAAVGGYPQAFVEFDTAAGGFSAAPTAGATINVYERAFNSDGNQAPVVDSSNKNKYLGSWQIDPADAQQYLPPMLVNISYYGATFYVEWLDGGAGTASVDSGWVFRVTPATVAPGA